MTVDVNVETIPVVAGEDLAGNMFYILKYDASGQGIKCTDDTDLCCGVLYTDIPSRDPDTTGQALPMAPIDQPAIIRMRAGGAISRGYIAVPDGANEGKIKGYAIGSVPHGINGIGVLLDAATVENDVVRVQPMRQAGLQAEIYRGAWAAGVFVPGQVTRFSNGLYMCIAARTASNTNDPATDTASWEQISS